MSDQPIDISKLPLEQVGNILKQLDEETQYLQNSITQLKMVSSKFQDSSTSLQNFKPENEGKDIFIPLTSSLYVPGTLSNVNSVLIDIGTGYYFEKTISGAQDYISRRTKDLAGKIDLIQKKLDSNRKSLIQVQMVYQAKLQQVQQMKPQTQ